MLIKVEAVVIHIEEHYAMCKNRIRHKQMHFYVFFYHKKEILT